MSKPWTPERSAFWWKIVYGLFALAMLLYAFAGFAAFMAAGERS